MQELKSNLSKRFGESIQPLKNSFGEFLYVKLKNGSSILLTTGLSDFKMPVHEKHIGKEYIELYFNLPSYWELEDSKNPKFSWVFSWLERLKNYVINNNTWFGHGHTMPCGKEMKSLSESMLQNHFILSDPIDLETELSPIIEEEKTIRFLAIIPIFPDEMDFKQGKGTFKLMEKFRQYNVTEKLDDYRKTILKTRWNIMGR
ncbi:hypothetical protein LBMAG51_12950 [Phycisphaerae bacterium]|nr:hypothetical protein LBMAG51_12950 [Phycisphaerae bacterium]